MAETKYCRDCGIEIEDTAEKCPECGAQQPGVKNIKYCSNCGSTIDENAEICPECGVKQGRIGSYQQVETPTYRQPRYQLKNPGLAAVLSAFFVGFGQIYNGEIGKGLLLIVVYFISILMIFVLIGFITTPLIWIFGIYDAYNTAKRINAGEIVV
jgi:TM2 domain-containing membrane protein YozV/RNA polymerase subunit RPABC4/transcription elongation factor Spt4